MESISRSRLLAQEIAESCLAGREWSEVALTELVGRATSENASVAWEASRALFRDVVECLGDLFEPRLCAAYAQLFSSVIEKVHPELRASDMLARYERIRSPRRCRLEPRNIFVLSRVTLGADVAVSSVMLDGLKRRFPSARIHLVGSAKNYRLFEADERILHVPFTYGRSGSLRERLSEWPIFPDRDSIVVDPDSRLSQLGLLPVADEDRYFFFESRAYGGDSEDPLPVLASRWMTETFDVDHARTFIAPLRAEEPADVSISFGVGENAEKLVPGNFEPELICALVKRGRTILIDKGSGGDETARVERAIDAAGPSAHITAWHGDYAPFAARIARSNLYVGYDSAGQHVAAACGIPLISIFAGYVSPRMLQRWRPTGAGPITVIPVDEMSPAEVLRQTLAAV